ncbi:MAG: hypothetical protein ABSB60_11025 [Terracidiphilus sp.]
MKPAKRARTEDAAENKRIDAEIERILATEEDLIPSSGFMASVMERVADEAAVPPPIPFPWKRAVPGIVLAAGVFGWGAVELVRLGLPTLHSYTLSLPQISAGNVHSVESAGWVALALGVSLLSWLLSRRLAGRGGLL